MIETKIVSEKIEPFLFSNNQTDDGAELTFNGRVRRKEGNHLIIALEYECYKEMAENELRIIAEKVAQKFPIHHLLCRHRVGRVPVGEISIQVTIRSTHRSEAFEAMTCYISELKHRVPIWKWAILKDGSKHPIKPM